MVAAFSHLTRISHEGLDCFAAEGHQWRIHDEGEFATAARLRLVFEAASEPAVVKLLATLPIASMAQLVRQQSLLGLELVLVNPLSAAQQQSVTALSNVEVLPIAEHQHLPLLRTPGLLVMDMDSTAIQIECIDELAAAAGVGQEVAAVTERAMQGELDFEQSLRARVAKLAGAPSRIIDELCERLPLSPGLEPMIAELQQYQWRTVVASGGFTPFVGHLKQLLTLDAAYANELVLKDEQFTGEVTGTIVDAQFKADTVTHCAKQWQIAAPQTVAIGDGANDIPMVATAAFGIAYHAKPKLAAAADASIKQLNLAVLPYFLQA
ncbi:phosphoserine phosphatase SerB [Shewanella sp. C32]|uniref:Phosphoserine phosphatase n=1 Tax=Shewanella electrica TaxID=515560 RepID=A0ABT2FJU9_9GAMM|nr:phosphoserine phosphatase SerB [Shewanella electrica]MCH1924380.1 phosphoserine phosphatase SerB [Shewanella electrica]MCS4556281.1 phosphoserine phosphatase SerB [Shewanella electrica]